MTQTRPRRRLLLTTVAGAGALLLAGCASAAAPAASGSGALRAEPAAVRAAAAEIPTCDGDGQDGQPANASLDPAGITTNPGSWPADSTMATIRKAKKLTVGVAGDVQQWGSRNPSNGKIEGFDIDVLKRIATELGLDPETDIDYKVLNFAGRLPALDDKKVQLVAHTMTMTCDRWFGGDSTDNKFINFSSEYYRAGQKVLVRSDSKYVKVKNLTIEDLANEKVCAATGSTSLAFIQDKVKEPVEVDDVGDCLVKFQEGEATAITGDDTVLAGFAKQDQYAKVVGAPFSRVPYGIGVAPDKAGAEFTRFVNAVLQDMRSDGTLDQLYDKWMDGSGTRPAVPTALYGRKLNLTERSD